MADMVTATRTTCDLIDATLTPRGARCEECSARREPYTETEMLPGGRAETELCRACFRYAHLCCAAEGTSWPHAVDCLDRSDNPTCQHECPECGDTFGCWDGSCDRPAATLCADCDRGRR